MVYVTAETLSKYNKARSNLTKGEDRRLETIISYSDRSNWQSFLQPVPFTITLLGQILLVSSKKDFSLVTQNANFNKLRFPDSFRASMVQLSNEGWQAFNMANGNMDAISLESEVIPRYVKEAVECLFRASPRDIEAVLPGILKRIVQSADACTNLAEQTQQKFHDVMLLAHELLEAIIATKGTNEKQLQAIQHERQALQELLKQTKAQKAKEERVFSLLDKELKSTEKQFREAAKAIPSDWALIGMTVAEGLANATIASLNTVTSTMTNPFNFVIGKAGETARDFYNLSSCVGEIGSILHDVNHECVTEATGYGLSEKILPFIYALNGLLEVKADNKVGIDDNTTGERGAEYLKNMFRYLKPRIDTDETNGRFAKKKKNAQSDLYEAAEICTAGQNISEKVAKVANEFIPNQEVLHQLAREAKGLLQRAEAFNTKEKIVENMPATAAPIPNISKQSPFPDNCNIARMAIKNAQFRLEQTKAVLTQKQASFDKSNDNLRQTTENLTNLVSKMSNLKLESVDIEEVRKILLDATGTISQFQTQWGLLVSFFKSISNTIKVQLASDAVNNFVAYANEGNNSILGGVTISDFVRTNIYNYATQAGQISHFVNMISKTYIQVSEKYIMPPLSSLGALVAIDDPQKIKAQLRILQNDCEEAKVNIDNLLKQRRREFEDTCQERLSVLETTMRNILPPPDAETEQLNNAAIQEGIRRAIEEQLSNTMSEDINDLW